jgi:hypothetical protein
MPQLLRPTPPTLALWLTALAFGAAPALATPWVVTTTDDDGPGSLRAAVAAALPGDTITFDLPALPATIALAVEPVSVAVPLTITGPGADLLTISGSAASRVFAVNSGGPVTLEHLRIADGLATNGAGVLVHGATTELTLRDCVVEDNTATGELPLTQARGAGVFAVNGSLTIERCLFRDNTAQAVSNPSGPGLYAVGGGLYANTANGVTLRDSSFLNNQALAGASTAPGASGGVASGGGAFLSSGSGATTLIERSTFAANRVAGGASSDSSGGQATGGGLHLSGVAPASVVRLSTFSGNLVVGGLGTTQGAAAGGGLWAYEAGSLESLTITGNQVSSSQAAAGGGLGVAFSTLAGSIVSGNFGVTGPDVSSPSSTDVSLGHNLVTTVPAGTGFVAQPSDDVGNGTDPLLGPLGDYGGFTPTHLLRAGSPAIDHIPTPDCLSSVDQRGHPRPVENGCDLGAFEFEPEIFLTGFEPGDDTWSASAP